MEGLVSRVGLDAQMGSQSLEELDYLAPRKHAPSVKRPPVPRSLLDAHRAAKAPEVLDHATIGHAHLDDHVIVSASDATLAVEQPSEVSAGDG